MSDTEAQLRSNEDNHYDYEEEEEERISSNNKRKINDEEGEGDDDDEDYDDDELRSHKRARNKFIDDIAEVSDDEEDEDEDDEEAATLREQFIAADDNEVDSESLKADSRLHRDFDRAREKSNDENLEDLARSYKQRYGKNTQKYRGDRVLVSQKLLMPSVNDPNIWAIRVTPGKEIDLIRQIMKKKLSLLGTKHPLEIYSAFQRKNFTGYIYIEASKVDAVDYALKGLVNVFLGRGKVLVPIAEYPDLLRPTKTNDVQLAPGVYVRIKRGHYKSDLAIVENISDNGLEVLCKLVPRLDYDRFTEFDENGRRKRNPNIARPPQRLFSELDAKKFDRSHPIIKEGLNSFRYKGETYIDGFLQKDFKIQYLETENVKPSLEELSKFNISGNLDLTPIAQTLKQSNMSSASFQPGDRVEVVKGEQRGVKGSVVSAERKEVINLKINSDDKFLNGRVIEVPTKDVIKVFEVGDHVRVIHGKHLDDTGLVMEANNQSVTFVSDQSRKVINVFANYLIKSTDGGATNSMVGKYDLHDLVQLNAQRFGIIIKVERELFTILCSDNRVINVSPTSIFDKITLQREQAVSTDSNNLEIKIGDTVKEKGGERRQGTILHIYKSVLFLKSRTIVENSGIFAIDSSNVTTISNKGTLKAKASRGPDLSKMNPSRQLQPSASSATTKISMGRDRSINQRVMINVGPYKTLQGIIKDANGDLARVELHSKNKTLSISKSKLSIYKNDGTWTPYNQWVNEGLFNYNGRNNKNSFTNKFDKGNSYTSNRNDNSNYNNFSNGGSSQWGNNSRSSGKESSWHSNGNATAYGNNGNATAYGSRNGGNSSWSGNASSWGGNATSYGGAGNGTSYNGAGNGTSYGGAGNNTSYGGASAWAGNRTAYGSGSASAYKGNETSYGGSSAWNPNSGHETSGNNVSRDEYDSYGSWRNNAVTPAAIPETPAGGEPAATPGTGYGNHYDDNNSYDN